MPTKKKTQTKIKVTPKPKAEPRVLSAKEELEKEIDVASALDAMSVSEGGVILSENLVADILMLVELLAGKFKKMAHIELITTCADLKTKLDILRVLSRAGKNKDFLREQLEEALRQ